MRPFALVFFGLVLVSPLYASCDSPAAPACATQTVPFTSVQDFDACREKMLAFRDAMDTYAACLRQTSVDEARQARDTYEEVRVQFNRRARGEYGSTPEPDEK